MRTIGGAAVLAAALLSCGVPARAQEPGSRPFIGADLSFDPELQSRGAVYYVGGVPADPLEIFRAAGDSVIRLRLWHSPKAPWNGLDATIAHAERAALAGYSLLLDIHYSDTWADPAHQIKPAAWEGLDFPVLVDSVYSYTNDVIRAFRDAGVTPRYVQIGNEVSAGFLWPEGRVGGSWDTPEQWSQYAALVSAASSAVHDSLPETDWPAIVLHVDNGGNNVFCRWFFDNVEVNDIPYDAIGLSYYPWWHGTFENLRGNLRDLAPRYGREIIIVETGYPWTLANGDDVGNFVSYTDQLLPGYPASPEGQKAFLREVYAVLAETPGGRGAGLIYWEPAFISVPGGPLDPYENMALFDFEGNALPGVDFRAGAGGSGD